ncbi:hypothetical protein [Falsiroseomonas ponticola]|jgi:hypothetical protein|uniref:hypothetical protein n=1 Tax=Falsiroseomonas ponticola TaxID=2786951 RepID=UPI001932CDF0|nr:hypothetical protein [Roseomonas ponticola]
MIREPVSPAAAGALRDQLRAAQAGAEVPYREALAFVAARAAAAATAEGRAPEPAAEAALLLLHAHRHTYDPRRDPVAWVDAIIAWALPRAGRAAPAWGLEGTAD